MNLLPLALLVAALLVNDPVLAQTDSTPAQPATPAAPSAPATQAAPDSSKPAAGGTAGAPAAPTTRQITVASLTDKEFKGRDGSDLGDISRVVESAADRKAYVVVSRGGLFGFFGTEYLVPVDQIAVTGEEVVAKNMTKEQLEGTTPFVAGDAAYRLLDSTTMVSVPEPR